MPYPDQITARLTARGLRLDRACTQEYDGACWLFNDLDRWNKVLHLARLELVEVETGWLTLRSSSTKQRLYHHEEYIYDAVYVFCWLPKVHTCVLPIRLEDAVVELFHQPAFALSLDLGRRCNVQDHALRGTYDTLICEVELVEALGALRAFESMDFSYFPVNKTIASQLVTLLRRNSNNITSVAIEGNRMSHGTANQILLALHHCHFLNQLSLVNNTLDEKCIESLSGLLRASKSLSKLTLHGYACFRRQADLQELSAALELNTSLTELCMRRCEADFSSVLEAIKVNKTLKHLDLSRSLMNDRQAATLSSALKRNTGLRHLVLEHCGIHDDAAGAIAAAVKTNCALETLSLKGNLVTVSGVTEFCQALRSNKTIKMVQFSLVAGSQQERTNLSSQMAEDKIYNRILMTWSDLDILPLSAAVALAPESPTELHIRRIYDLNEHSVCTLLENLATNTKVEVLTMEVGQYSMQVVRALCSALAVNKGIRRLEVTTIDDSASDCGMFSSVAKALLLNNTVTDLKMQSGAICPSSIKAIACMLSRNTSITKFAAKSNRGFSSKHFTILSRALNRNKNILEFALFEESEASCLSHRVRNTLRRNVILQKLAIRFVTKERLDIRAALAFEELCSSASFLAHVMKIMNQSEEEARSTTRSAHRYIETNYLRLVGVVWESVVCYASTSTQLDDLNPDCWSSIAKHLKLSHVVQEEP